MTNVSPGLGFSEPVVCVAPQYGTSSIIATSISPLSGFGIQDIALVGPSSGVGTQVSAQVASQYGTVYPSVILPE